MKYLTLLLLAFAFLQAEEAAAPSEQKPVVKPEEAWVAVTDEDDDAEAAELAQDDSGAENDCGCGKKKKG